MELVVGLFGGGQRLPGLDQRLLQPGAQRGGVRQRRGGLLAIHPIQLGVAGRRHDAVRP